jgi:hypothetical protein
MSISPFVCFIVLERKKKGNKRHTGRRGRRNKPYPCLIDM